jgi:hypothetical protein
MSYSMSTTAINGVVQFYDKFEACVEIDSKMKKFGDTCWVNGEVLDEPLPAGCYLYLLVFGFSQHYFYPPLSFWLSPSLSLCVSLLSLFRSFFFSHSLSLSLSLSVFFCLFLYLSVLLH